MRIAAFLFSFACWAAQEVPSDIPALMQAGNAAYMKGDYEAARRSFATAWDAVQQSPRENPLRYDILKRLTSVRAASGEFADADNFLQLAINWRETVIGPNDPKIVDDYLISVGLCRGMKEYSRAHAVLSRVMTLHRQQFGGESSAIADDFSRSAQIFMDQKDIKSAVNSLNTAVEIRTKISGALDISLVPDLDRMAGASLAMRRYDKAEEAYRHALVIRETLFGKEDADLIASVDGLAYASYGQKKWDEADALYRRLIALWVKSVGDDHPMVAMALDKVAVFYADQKKYDQAKEAQSRANAIRAKFLASGLSTEATEQIAEGNKDAAIGLYRRALLVMDPPHAVYDELRTEIDGLVKSMEAPPVRPPQKKAAPKKK